MREDADDTLQPLRPLMVDAFPEVEGAAVDAERTRTRVMGVAVVRPLRFSLALVVAAAAAFLTAVGMSEPGHCEVVPLDQTFAVEAQPMLPTPPEAVTVASSATARSNTMRFPLYVTRCE